MSKKGSILFRSGSLFLLTIFCFGSVFAQDKKDKNDDDDLDTVVTTEVSAPLIEARTMSYKSEDEDDSKTPGATLRGRIIYEDTSRPVRYALITLLADKTEDTGNSDGLSLRAAAISPYSSKFVRTDENGEFVIKNVKAGTYTPYIKSEGILNQDPYNDGLRQTTAAAKSESPFEKITVSGLGEFQTTIRARRGGAISGRILYADGEPAVGVKIEVLRKDGELFSSSSLLFGYGSNAGKAQTDDRGFYRFSGLPEGNYIVRVNEPLSHTQESNDSQSSFVKTYYPEGETAKNAREIEVLLGQEQTAIDINLPEHRFFGISGKIVKKADGEPLENFTVSFTKLSDRDEMVMDSYYASGGSATLNSAKSNKAGEWALKSLSKGKYRITITQGYVYRSEKEKDKKQPQYPNLSKEIEITDKNLADLNFEVPVESVISGIITVEGGKEVSPSVQIFAVEDETKVVSYSGFDDNLSKNSQAIKEKPFSIGKLREGKYRLFFANPNYYLKSATLGGKDLMNAPIEIKEGEQLKDVRIVLASDMGTVRGEVKDYDENEGAIAVIVKTGMTVEQVRFGGSFSGQIMPTGKFEIKAAPGEYSIFIFKPKERPKTEAEAKALFQNMIKDAAQVSVKSGEIVNVSLNMPN